jgi:hypothetical protein
MPDAAQSALRVDCEQGGKGRVEDSTRPFILFGDDDRAWKEQNSDRINRMKEQASSNLDLPSLLNLANLANPVNPV